MLIKLTTKYSISNLQAFVQRFICTVAYFAFKKIVICPFVSKISCILVVSLHCFYEVRKQSSPNRQSSWRVISLHVPQKVWPFKHRKIYKRTEIHWVNCPKFGGTGPWDQENRAHFRAYFNPSATCFIFPTYDVDNKTIQTIMKLTKIFRGKVQSDSQENELIWP